MGRWGGGAAELHKECRCGVGCGWSTDCPPLTAFAPAPPAASPPPPPPVPPPINKLLRCAVLCRAAPAGKDAGRLAAAWALYKAQEELVAVCKDRGIQLTLFHGRGGTGACGTALRTALCTCLAPVLPCAPAVRVLLCAVPSCHSAGLPAHPPVLPTLPCLLCLPAAVGRGGGPMQLAIQSQPPGSVQGSLRITEQASHRCCRPCAAAAPVPLPRTCLPLLLLRSLAQLDRSLYTHLPELPSTSWCLSTPRLVVDHLHAPAWFVSICCLQGEMVQAKFGVPSVALRQLEVFNNSVLLATLQVGGCLLGVWLFCRH